MMELDTCEVWYYEILWMLNVNSGSKIKNSNNVAVWSPKVWTSL